MVAATSRSGVWRRSRKTDRMAAQNLESQIEQVARRAQYDLSSLGQTWALIGGLAVSARCEPRFTRDIDLAVALDDDQQAETLIHELQGRGYRVAWLLEQETAGRLATVRLHPPGDEHGVVLDLLFASSGIEPEIVAAAQPVEVTPGLEVPVAQ